MFLATRRVRARSGEGWCCLAPRRHEGPPAGSLGVFFCVWDSADDDRG